MESESSNYINASKIHDDDPRQVAYIATQAPLQNTVIDFWKMVWEQGIALIVNLCDQEDQKTQKYIKYWPEEGSKVFGIFEVFIFKNIFILGLSCFRTYLERRLCSSFTLFKKH